MSSRPAHPAAQHLADDLAWLEAHCRARADLHAHAPTVRFAAATVRNAIAPYLSGARGLPLHLAVVGGAGAGKSTVANLLIGAAVAESNPQAGYTRHPIGFASPARLADVRPGPLFLQPLKRLLEPAPSDRDEDCYQLRESDPARSPLLETFVVWDCPDMTAWAAEGYAARLVEVAALADVICYVASDERYNDIVPTRFLQLLLEAGKPVVVCLTKMPAEQAGMLADHFRGEVLAKLPAGRVTVLTIPHLPTAALADPNSPATTAARIPLWNQTAVLGEPADLVRRHTALAGTLYLRSARDGLLRLLGDDVAALGSWAATVDAGKAEFDNRYVREHLSGERFARFDEALVRLMELLEVPGVGRVVGGALWVVRTPYRLFKGLMNQVFAPPQAGPMLESAVLESALRAWADMLHAEAVRRSADHPLWGEVAAGYETELLPALRAAYADGVKKFQSALGEEVERTARAIYTDLEKSPGTLNALRGGKLALDVAAVTASLVVGHVGLHDVVLVPLAASVSHQLVEWAGAQYVDGQREAARERQRLLADRFISSALADLLRNWPARQGGTYERLQTARARIPASIAKLAAELGLEVAP